MKTTGLTKRELNLVRRECVAAVRKTIKAQRLPRHASIRNYCAVLDAVLDGVGIDREILQPRLSLELKQSNSSAA